MESARGAIEQLESTTVGGYPHATTGILEERHHGVEAQARGIPRDGMVDADRAAIRTGEVHATGERADPQRAARVLHQRPDRAAVQSGGVVRIEPVVPEVLRREIE